MSKTYQHSATVRKIVHHLVAVICPPDAKELGIVDDVANHMAKMMGALPAVLRQAMLAGIMTYDLGALASAPLRGKRAHQLDVAQGSAYFDSWLHGPTPLHRQLGKTFMQLLNLGYYEHPAVQTQIGYTPAAWIEKVTKRRLQVYQDKIDIASQRITASDPLRPGVNIKEVLSNNPKRKGHLTWQ
jgi:hypothetical protein